MRNTGGESPRQNDVMESPRWLAVRGWRQYYVTLVVTPVRCLIGNKLNVFVVIVRVVQCKGGRRLNRHPIACVNTSIQRLNHISLLVITLTRGRWQWYTPYYVLRSFGSFQGFSDGLFLIYHHHHHHHFFTRTVDKTQPRQSLNN